jgi:hypothetical protein
MVFYGILWPRNGKCWYILLPFLTFHGILWPFGIVCGHLVYLFPFWYVAPRQILAFMILTIFYGPKKFFGHPVLDNDASKTPPKICPKKYDL